MNAAKIFFQKNIYLFFLMAAFLAYSVGCSPKTSEERATEAMEELHRNDVLRDSVENALAYFEKLDKMGELNADQKKLSAEVYKRLQEDSNNLGISLASLGISYDTATGKLTASKSALDNQQKEAKDGETSDVAVEKDKDGETSDVAEEKDKDGETSDVAEEKDKDGETNDVAVEKDKDGETNDVAEKKDKDGETNDVAEKKDKDEKTNDVAKEKDKDEETNNVAVEKDKDGELTKILVGKNGDKERTGFSVEKINLIDIEKSYEMFSKQIPPRSEFETKSEYLDKIFAYLSNNPLFNGNPDSLFYFFIDDVRFTYGADEKEGRFHGPEIIKKYDGRRFLTMKTNSTVSTYAASNAFGAETKVTKREGKCWGIFFENPSKDVDDKIGCDWEKKMSVEEGKAVKDNCAAVVQFQIAPISMSDDPKIWLKDFDYKKPEYSSPYERSFYLFGLAAKNIRLIFFNKTTGEIVLNINFNTYKSKWTIQEEKREEQIRQEKIEKKERIQQKETDHFKKAFFFFMDWKTPNGIVNAQYVKMNGKNVVLQDEKGKQIEVPLDSFDKQNRDLLELAKCFKKVKSKLQKERVWTYAHKTQYIKSRKDSIPLTFRGTFQGATANFLLIKTVDGEKITVHMNELSPKDVAWVNKTHQVFLEKLGEYENKYNVRLLEPLDTETDN